MKKDLSEHENKFCNEITDTLIRFWDLHRGFDANIKGLAKYAGVSRDTVYRWLNRKALPRLHKAMLIEGWLKIRRVL